MNKLVRNCRPLTTSDQLVHECIMCQDVLGRWWGGGYLGRYACHHTDGAVLKLPEQIAGILVGISLNRHNAGASLQGQEGIQNCHIKTDRGALQEDVICIEAADFLGVQQVVDDAAVGHRDTLGPPGGAAGVDDVSQAVPCGWAGWSAAVAIGLFLPAHQEYLQHPVRVLDMLKRQQIVVQW